MPIMEINGLSLYYNVQGEGSPIIFIHPPMLSSINFKYQLTELSKNFKVIVFDIRGHGRSQASRQPITYSLIAGDIKRLMDYVEVEKAFLCGYSTGGSIVLESLLTYPDRLLGGVVIGGMSEVNHWRLKSMISVGAALAKAGAVNTLAYTISQGNSDTKTLFREMFKEAKKADPDNVEQYYRYSLVYNCTDQLPKINLPVLLVYGAKDKHFHSYGKLLHSRLPYSEMKFIAEAKHQIPTKSAIELNDLVRQFVYTTRSLSSPR